MYKPGIFSKWLKDEDSDSLLHSRSVQELNQRCQDIEILLVEEEKSMHAVQAPYFTNRCEDYSPEKP